MRLQEIGRKMKNMFSLKTILKSVKPGMWELGYSNSDRAAILQMLSNMTPVMADTRTDIQNHVYNV